MSSNTGCVFKWTLVHEFARSDNVKLHNVKCIVDNFIRTDSSGLIYKSDMFYCVNVIYHDDNIEITILTILIRIEREMKICKVHRINDGAIDWNKFTGVGFIEFADIIRDIMTMVQNESFDVIGCERKDISAKVPEMTNRIVTFAKNRFGLKN